MAGSFAGDRQADLEISDLLDLVVPEGWEAGLDEVVGGQGWELGAFCDGLKERWGEQREGQEVLDPAGRGAVCIGDPGDALSGEDPGEQPRALTMLVTSVRSMLGGASPRCSFVSTLRRRIWKGRTSGYRSSSMSSIRAAMALAEIGQ
ncbi:hypothetical protein AAD018_009290 [Aestuariibius insulae]|uniref:hypothetical protein n=1 Tax=Aestuariibius insulae TaxID=2058287 RepID=UPI00345E8D73